MAKPGNCGEYLLNVTACRVYGRDQMLPTKQDFGGQLEKQRRFIMKRKNCYRRVSRRYWKVCDHIWNVTRNGHIFVRGKGWLQLKRELFVDLMEHRLHCYYIFSKKKCSRVGQVFVPFGNSFRAVAFRLLQTFNKSLTECISFSYLCSNCNFS